MLIKFSITYDTIPIVLRSDENFSCWSSYYDHNAIKKFSTGGLRNSLENNKIATVCKFYKTRSSSYKFGNIGKIVWMNTLECSLITFHLFTILQQKRLRMFSEQLHDGFRLSCRVFSIFLILNKFLWFEMIAKRRRSRMAGVIIANWMEYANSANQSNRILNAKQTNA